MNLRQIHWMLKHQFGIDFISFGRGVSALPRFYSQSRQYRAQLEAKTRTGMPHEDVRMLPCLHDSRASSGNANSEYFWQDLYVARKIFLDNPTRHVDIGSRIDGFVGHLASFREVEVIDIRTNDASVPGIRFIHADITKPTIPDYLISASVSCLHSIEHFGLGRYGDTLDVDGPAKGLKSLANLVQPRGKLYLSAPVGRAATVFNANKIFDPRWILSEAAKSGLTLVELATIDDALGVQVRHEVEEAAVKLASQTYTLAIFTFIKD